MRGVDFDTQKSRDYIDCSTGRSLITQKSLIQGGKMEGPGCEIDLSGTHPDGPAMHSMIEREASEGPTSMT